MSGSGDQLAAHERGTDHARPREQDSPRETRAQPTDLQGRLERLPIGHPSSPYRDDGSRKPPPPDLSGLELDLPDEIPPGPDQPDQDLATEDKPRVDPDGSWHWKGLELKPHETRAADQALAKCREVERYVTPALRRAESQLDHGRLVDDTEKYCLKESDRFKEKLASRIKLLPGENPAVLAARIHDGIRYTFVYDDADYFDGVYQTEAAVEQQGFDLTLRKPSWDKPEYKGINSQWQDPDSGQLFEIQFHTHTSWEAKQTTHQAYAKLSDSGISRKERKELEDYQEAISASIPIPSRALEIPHYRREDSKA